MAEGFDRFEWLKQKRRVKCPDCGRIPESNLIKTVCWCPECKRIWRLIRSQHVWQVTWWYENGDHSYLRNVVRRGVSRWVRVEPKKHELQGGSFNEQ